MRLFSANWGPKFKNKPTFQVLLFVCCTNFHNCFYFSPSVRSHNCFLVIRTLNRNSKSPFEFLLYIENCRKHLAYTHTYTCVCVCVCIVATNLGYLVTELHETTSFLKSPLSLSWSTYSSPSMVHARHWILPWTSCIQSIRSHIIVSNKCHITLSLMPRYPRSLSSSHITLRHIPAE